MGTLAIICVVLFVVLVVIALPRPGGFTSGDGGAGWFPWSGDGDSGFDGGGGGDGGAA